MRRPHVQICAGVVATAVLGVWIASSARSAPPATPAPLAAGAGEVPFDHTIHAGTYRIPCLACHVYANRSAVAGLPSGRKCMGCHKFVAKEAPAIQLLATRLAAGQPVGWPRVFAVPDFIYFSHRMHVRANVACADCHGDVAKQKTVTQDQPFTMGRCVTCHAARHATRDCLGCHK
jgi:Cytochrome c7 and related cytochrome c